MSFKIYGKPGCADCNTAKNFLEHRSVPHEYIDIMKDSAAMKMFRENGFRAVPQIFDGESHVGGLQDLMSLVAGGQAA